MIDQNVRYVGTYLPNEVYLKLKLLCVKKDISVSKVLLSLVVTLVKDVKLIEEINIEKETTSGT